MRNKMPIKYFQSYEEADMSLLNQSLKMKPEERVEAVNIIRRKVFSLKGIRADNRVKKILFFGAR